MLTHALVWAADCPCHGSHFDKHGKCLHGPAVEDLAPVTIGAFGIQEDKEAKAARHSGPRGL